MSDEGLLLGSSQPEHWTTFCAKSQQSFIIR